MPGVKRRIDGLGGMHGREIDIGGSWNGVRWIRSTDGRLATNSDSETCFVFNIEFENPHLSMNRLAPSITC